MSTTFFSELSFYDCVSHSRLPCQTEKNRVTRSRVLVYAGDTVTADAREHLHDQRIHQATPGRRVSMRKEIDRGKYMLERSNGDAGNSSLIYIENDGRVTA